MKSFETITSDPDLLEFLSHFSATEVEKGWKLFYTDAVQDLSNSMRDDGTISAVVLEPRRRFECELQFDELFGWEGHCTCPKDLICCHMFATLMTALSRSGSTIKNKPFGKRSGAALQEELPLSAAQQPKSPLTTRLLELYEGKPRKLALKYVSKINDLFRRVHDQNRAVVAGDLQDLGHPLDGSHWLALELWPVSPTSVTNCGSTSPGHCGSVGFRSPTSWSP